MMRVTIVDHFVVSSTYIYVLNRIGAIYIKFRYCIYISLIKMDLSKIYERTFRYSNI